MDKSEGFPGKRITEFRKALGLNQIELAEKLNLNQNQVSRYETGTSNPTIHTLSEMAKLFNTSTDYLLGLTDYPEPTNPELPSTQTSMVRLMSTQPEAVQRKLLAVARLLVELED